jgi:hypothetical protein
MWPTWPELTGAPRYAAMVLRFQCFLFLRIRWSARNSARGSSTSGGLRSRACSDKVRASTFDDGGGMLQGSAHGKVGWNGCSANRRTPTSGRWSSRSVTRGVAMKVVNLEFISVSFEIPVQRPSIYRGFRQIISCACRTLSPSSQIWLGFINPFDFVEILAGGVFVSMMTRHGVGNDRRRAAPGPRTSEVGAGSAGPAGSNSAHGQITLEKVFLIFKSFLNSKPIWIYFKFKFWWLLFVQ